MKLKIHCKLIVLSSLILFCFPHTIFTRTVSNIKQLKLNVAINNRFENTQQDFYSVKVDQNEAIEIECERFGTDIYLTVFDPDKEKIINSNSPPGFIGKDTLFFIAKKAGVYEVVVKSRRPGTFVGHYTIIWRGNHQANDKEIAKFQGLQSLGNALNGLEVTKNRFDTATLAIEDLKRAAQTFDSINDKPNLATSFFQIGYKLAKEQGNERDAIIFYEKALKIWRELDDEKSESIVLAHLAYELRTNGERVRSKDYLEEARRLNRKFEDVLDESITLSFTCKLLNDTQAFQKGFEVCREALRLGQKRDPVTDYDIYFLLCGLYGNVGDRTNSIKYLNLSHERILLTGNYLNPIRLALVKASFGGILESRYAETLPYFLAALKASETAKFPFYIAYYSFQISSTFTELKEFSKAVEYGEKSLKLFQQYYPSRRQAPLRVLAKAYAGIGKNEQARQMWNQAVELNSANHDSYAEAETLAELSQFEKDLGNTEASLRLIQQAVILSELTRSQLFGQSQRASYVAILRGYYETEIGLLADQFAKNEDLKFFERSWQSQEKVRARSLVENFLENGYNVKTPENVEFSQNEQILLEKVARALQKSNQAENRRSITTLKESEVELQAALDEYQLLKEDARKRNPQFSVLNSPKEFSLIDAQQSIDDDTGILEFGMGDRQSFAWFIGKTSVKLVKLPPKGVINQLSRDFYDSIVANPGRLNSTAFEKGLKLSKLIIQPFGSEISRLKRLVIIAEGSLQLVPFSLLSSADNEPLKGKLEIVNAPSFASLAYLRENKNIRQHSKDKTLAILADPIFQLTDERLRGKKPSLPRTNSKFNSKLKQILRDFGADSFSRLPFSGIEAREIASFAPNETIIATGVDASRQNLLKGDFSKYRILHFATHGLLNQKNPELSGLVLSLYDTNRIEQNGFLRVIDLYSLRIDSDLVVLSACQTALGKDVNGEEIVGLTNGFLYAGASSVLSTLWKVDDAATSEFMSRFYRALLKENQLPSAALRTAQNELKAIPRFSNPRYWAGFVLTGEWK